MLTKRRIYEFDDYRVDTGQFLLTRGGRSEAITPTVFRILLILLERAAQVVTKEELMKDVWPDSFVEEGNLNRNVSTLRKALGEKPCDHRYIETIPKTGYRFISPVRVMDYQAPTGAARQPSKPSARQIVGRDFELDALRRAFENAQDNHGGVVLIEGDVGLGKTALVDAFIDDLRTNGQDFHLARARCSESITESEAFVPWIEALSCLTQEPTVDEVMVKVAPSWHQEITHTGSTDTRRMKRELADLCAQVSPVHPLIVVLDDFHWSDVDSADLLAFLATRLDSTRVLVVVPYRLVEMKIKNHPFLRIRLELLSRGACTEVRLAPLTLKHIEEHVLQQKLNIGFPAEYAQILHTKSEGNPLFLRELMSKQNNLGDAVRNMAQGKIDRLDDTRRQLLATASVQGREFDSAVLASTMQLQSQDVEESLQELDEVHGLIRRIREEELPDGKFTVRYRFVYALYQEACYASLAPTRKASLSASLAEAFLTYYGN